MTVWWQGPQGAQRMEGTLPSALLSSLELRDTNVYEPSIRARLGTAAHFCEVVVLKCVARVAGTATARGARGRSALTHSLSLSLTHSHSLTHSLSHTHSLNSLTHSLWGACGRDRNGARRAGAQRMEGTLPYMATTVHQKHPLSYTLNPTILSRKP